MKICPGRIAGIVLVIGLSLIAILLSINLTPNTAPALPFSTNGFVTTTLPSIGVPANASFLQKLSFHLVDFSMRYRERHPQPNAWSFPPNSARGSVQGLLNQCMQASSVRYLIPPEIAAGSVHFTHTNTLNGSQWLAGVEQALASGQVEWWDADAKIMRSEKLALLHYPAQKTKVVMPLSQAKDFQAKYPTNGASLMTK
jgi:hypothetical protein